MSENPTPEECRQLAEAFPEHFEWREPKIAYGRLTFYLGETRVAILPHAGWFITQGHRDCDCSPELGQAALTAKCVEVARPAGLSWKHDINGWKMWREYEPITHKPSPWAALLATKTEVAPDGE